MYYFLLLKYDWNSDKAKVSQFAQKYSVIYFFEKSIYIIYLTCTVNNFRDILGEYCQTCNRGALLKTPC